MGSHPFKLTKHDFKIKFESKGTPNDPKLLFFLGVRVVATSIYRQNSCVMTKLANEAYAQKLRRVPNQGYNLTRYQHFWMKPTFL